MKSKSRNRLLTEKHKSHVLKKQEEEITKLKKGQTTKLKGECRGQLIISTVSLDDCEIITK